MVPAGAIAAETPQTTPRSLVPHLTGERAFFERYIAYTMSNFAPTLVGTIDLFRLKGGEMFCFKEEPKRIDIAIEPPPGDADYLFIDIRQQYVTAKAINGPHRNRNYVVYAWTRVHKSLPI